MVLLAATSLAATPSGWGRPDEDAACLAASLRLARTAELSMDAAFDDWIYQLLPYASSLAVPDSCAGHVEVWVAAASGSDLELCARITAGAGFGRNACVTRDDGIYEQTTAVTSTPTEPTTVGSVDPLTVLGGAAEARPEPVLVRGVDGRIVRHLDAAGGRACGEGAVGALLTALLSYDAAFDVWETDPVTLGTELGVRDDCDAYVAARVAVADDTEVRVEAVVLRGEARGRGYWAGADGIVHDAGFLPVDRPWLEAHGWWFEDPVAW